MGKEIIIHFSGYIVINAEDYPDLPVMVIETGEDIQLKDINPEELVGDSKYSLSLSSCLNHNDTDCDLDQFDIIVREE